MGKKKSRAKPKKTKAQLEYEKVRKRVVEQQRYYKKKYGIETVTPLTPTQIKKQYKTFVDISTGEQLSKMSAKAYKEYTKELEAFSVSLKDMGKEEKQRRAEAPVRSLSRIYVDRLLEDISPFLEKNGAYGANAIDNLINEEMGKDLKHQQALADAIEKMYEEGKNPTSVDMFYEVATKDLTDNMKAFINGVTSWASTYFNQNLLGD